MQEHRIGQVSSSGALDDILSPAQGFFLKCCLHSTITRHPPKPSPPLVIPPPPPPLVADAPPESYMAWGCLLVQVPTHYASSNRRTDVGIKCSVTLIFAFVSLGIKTQVQRTVLSAWPASPVSRRAEPGLHD